VARGELPTGTVTLLFTDVAGSTRLLHDLGDDAYADALTEHRRLLRAAFRRNQGVEVDTQGDAFFVAFASADRAVAAAIEARASLEPTRIRVRAGIHTGTPLRTEEGYVGADVHRAARIAAAGHGGQILISASTRAHVSTDGLEFVDLGEHRLKDLAAPERIFQLGGGEFARLKSLFASNLPIPAMAFQGRAAELGTVVSALADPAVRLFTISGPGGIGKTRLALQAAAESSESFPGGLWWVALAPLRDPELALPALAEVVHVRDEEGVPLVRALAQRLTGSRTLVVLDNVEHLLPDIGEDVAALLQKADGLTVLATSRERLQLTAEHVFVLPAMSEADAELFFCERAATHAVAVERTAVLAELCERLDRLPLALQLAAARTRTFSIEQLLERLSQRLDLLRGERDLEPRQRTLRATLEWSHELLTPDEAALYRRLSVFRGGCVLAAVEDVCDADADVLEGLVDKSLIQRRDGGVEPRFWQLETIREFASERLGEAGETDELRGRHADWYRARADDADRWLRAGEPEEVAVDALEADIDNLREAVAFGLESGHVQLVREVTATLLLYWIDRGLFGEARSWLDRALALDDARDVIRRRLLSALARIAYLQGDHLTAVAASDEAGELAMELAGVTERFERIDAVADAALLNEDFAAAEALLGDALDAATESDNGVGMSATRLGLASLAMQDGRFERAADLLGENLTFVRGRGQTRCEGFTLAGFSRLALLREQAREASEYALTGAERATRISAHGLLIICLERFARGAAELGEGRRAALLLGAVDAAQAAMGIEASPEATAFRAETLSRARRELDEQQLESALAEGREYDLEAAYTLAAAN